MAVKPDTKPITGKRKRGSPSPSTTAQTTLHITVGSYERVLHGFTATASPPTAEDDPSVDAVNFTDSFLLNAHTSSIRCLALSPPTSNRRTLATGSSDERINLYQISTIGAPASTVFKTTKLARPLLSTAAATPISTTTQRNRALGTLAHHSSTITTLAFPTTSKLLTASLDNTIAILRARDWQPLTTLKAPVPKPQGRPSGDTVGPGEVPAGVSDVAVHPSLRFAISVGLGERCMRLWNLVSGKKAGVLVFERKWLEAAGETARGFRGGEGRKIVWRHDGEQFAVAFEHGLLIYGLDCQVRMALKLDRKDKISQIRYLPPPPAERDQVPSSDNASTTNGSHATSQTPDLPHPGILVISTESGDVLFYSTGGEPSPANVTTSDPSIAPNNAQRLFAQLVRPPVADGAAPPRTRIKDFEILPIPSPAPPSSLPGSFINHHYYLVTGSSDGAVRIYSLQSTFEFHTPTDSDNGQEPTLPGNGAVDAHAVGANTQDHESASADADRAANGHTSVETIGTFLGVYETGKRITCLAAFVMESSTAGVNGEGDGVKEQEVEMDGNAVDDGSSDDEDGENGDSDEEGEGNDGPALEKELEHEADGGAEIQEEEEGGKDDSDFGGFDD